MKTSKFNVVIPLRDGNHLLHNTVTQSSIVLNRYEWLQLSREKGIEPLLRLRLQAIGALVDFHKDELAELYKQDYKKKKEEEDSVDVTVMMTEACNFGCQYCNQGDSKSSKFMSDEVFDSVMRYIQRLRAVKKISLSWYGGEPLIRKDDVCEFSTKLLHYSEREGLEYKSDIITNGYFLTKDVARRLKTAGVTCAQVTVDGNRNDHDNSRYIREGRSTFDPIMENIKSVLNETELHIVLRVNVSKSNKTGIYELVEYLGESEIGINPNFAVYFANIYSPSKNKIDEVDYTEVNGTVLDNYEFANIQFQLNRLCWEKGIKVALDMPSFQGACIATKRSSFAVTPSGDLHKCYIVMANKDEKVGEVMADGKIELDKQMFDRWDSWSAFSQSECSSCKLIGSCRGGCPLDYIKGETNGSENSFCPPAKYYFNEYVFQRAVIKGLVTQEQWNGKESETRMEELRFPK